MFRHWPQEICQQHNASEVRDKPKKFNYHQRHKFGKQQRLELPFLERMSFISSCSFCRPINIFHASISSAFDRWLTPAYKLACINYRLVKRFSREREIHFYSRNVAMRGTTCNERTTIDINMLFRLSSILIICSFHEKRQLQIYRRHHSLGVLISRREACLINWAAENEAENRH